MDMPRRFEIEPPRRVLVVGNHGSGRRELAALVSQKFALPLVDPPAESAKSAPDRRAEVTALVAAGDWVIEGFDFDALEPAMQRADWFVWLDPPVSGCIARVVRKSLRLRAPGKKPCRAGSGSLWARIARVLRYPAESLPKIIGAVERERRNRTIHILRSKSDVRVFIANLPRISGLEGDFGNGDKPVA